MNNGEALMYSPGRTLTPVMDLTLAQARLKTFQEFIGTYMKEGEDFGLIPGTPKKSLWKPGADKLCELYGLSDSYRIIDRLVDFDRGLFDYEIECTLSRDGMVISTGLGSCSSFEGKYRWRDSKRVCPQCGKETIIKGKKDYGGGWLCFAQKGGCGAKFEEGDSAIEGQEIGRIENDDIATLKNTILKMAKKRAKVDATLSATRSSGVFTQDFGDDEGNKKPASVQQPQRKSESQGQSTAPGVISEAQRGRLFAISKKAGYTEDHMKTLLAECGYQSSHDIQKKHYQAICETVESSPIDRYSETVETISKWCKEN